MKIIIAIDSFKGCLTSPEAGNAVATSLHTLNDRAQTQVLPMSDGGEGMLEAYRHAMGGTLRQVRVHDPLMRPITAPYAITPDGTAIIEMAQASGLTLLRRGERNPMAATSYGTGELIAAALRQGCRQMIVGLGGSATTDGGTGLLQALGVIFRDGHGSVLGHGGEMMQHIHAIDTTAALPLLTPCRCIIASDVSSPLCGPEGAACVFAPQKGADAGMVRALDSGLRQFARVAEHTLDMSVDVPAAGAAGGVGAALIGFLHAEVRSGIQLLLEKLDFDRMLGDADLVITGEGHADRQTLMGKMPCGVMRRARAQGVPTALVAGRVTDRRALLEAGFDEVIEVTPGDMPLTEAMQKETAVGNIRKAILNSSFIQSRIKF